MKRTLVTQATWAVFLAAGLLAGAGCSSQAKLKRHLDRAERYFGNERYSEAFVEYMNALRLDSTNRVAMRQIGLACFEMGDIQRAYPFLSKASELDPTNLNVRVKIGVIYLLAGQREKAREEAERVLGSSPDHLDGLVLLSDATSTVAGQKEVLKRLEACRGSLGAILRYQLALGNANLRVSQFDAAEKAYREAQRIDPKSPQPHQALGLLRRAQGDRAAAMAEYEKAAELSPPDSNARTQLAGIYLQEGRTNDAVRVLDEVARKKPDQASAQYMLAEIDFAQKRYDGCLKRLEQMLRIQPDNFSALTLRAKVRVAQGQAALAIEEYDRLVQRYPKSAQIRYQRAVILLSQKQQTARAQEDLQAALKIDPTFAAAQFMLAELQLRGGDAEKAATALETFVARLPDRSAERGQAILLLAAAYRARRTPEKAEPLYRNLLEQQPKSAQLHYLLGLSLLEQRKPAEAKDSFDRALQANPEAVLPLSQIVAIDVRAGKADAALQAVQKQIAAAPGSAPLHYLLGTVHVARRDMESAEQAFLKAIEIQPRYSGAYMALTRLYANTGKEREALKKTEAALKANPRDLASLMFSGAICQKLNDVDKAREYYEKALAVRPDFPAAANNLAVLYAENLKDLGKAYDLAKKARDSAPEDPYIADTLGWILYQKGDYKWAMPLIAESAEKLPENADLLYHLGMLHMVLGNEAAASDALRRALTGAQAFASAEVAGKVLDLLSTDPRTADLEPTLARLSADLSKDPRNLLLLLRTGQLWARKGDTEKGRSAFEKALKENTQFVPARVALAELLAGALKRPKEAVQEAQKAYDLAPGSPEAGAALGWAAFLNRDYPRAFTLLQEVKQRRPDSAAFLYRVAWAEYMMGRVDQARSDMDQAIKGSLSDEEKAAAAQFLSFPSPESSGLPDEAVTKVLDREPAYLPALVARAQSEEKQGRVPDAIKTYERVVEQGPQFAPAFRNLLRLYAETENGSDKAVSVGRVAREFAATEATVTKEFGIVTYCHKDYKGAKQLLAECAQKLPDDGDVAFFQGLCAKELKDSPAARQHLQRALDLKPNAGWAKRAREALAAL